MNTDPDDDDAPILRQALDLVMRAHERAKALHDEFDTDETIERLESAEQAMFAVEEALRVSAEERTYVAYYRVEQEKASMIFTASSVEEARTRARAWGRTQAPKLSVGRLRAVRLHGEDGTNERLTLDVVS
jgi:hypothetical protein